MRGQIFELEGCRFFTMGGARSHDIEDGVLNPKAPDFEEQYWALRRMGARFRVNHRSWWKQELPSKTEYEEARRSLERIQYEVDYVITHCAPSSIVDILGNGGYVHDHLTDFLEEVKKRAAQAAKKKKPARPKRGRNSVVDKRKAPKTGSNRRQGAKKGK